MPYKYISGCKRWHHIWAHCKDQHLEQLADDPGSLVLISRVIIPVTVCQSLPDQGGQKRTGYHCKQEEQDLQ